MDAAGLVLCAWLLGCSSQDDAPVGAAGSNATGGTAGSSGGQQASAGMAGIAGGAGGAGTTAPAPFWSDTSSAIEIRYYAAPYGGFFWGCEASRSELTADQLAAVAAVGWQGTVALPGGTCDTATISGSIFDADGTITGFSASPCPYANSSVDFGAINSASSFCDACKSGTASVVVVDRQSAVPTAPSVCVYPVGNTVDPAASQWMLLHIDAPSACTITLREQGTEASLRAYDTDGTTVLAAAAGTNDGSAIELAQAYSIAGDYFVEIGSAGGFFHASCSPR